MTGVPWIVWTATPDMFAALCRAISAAKQAILCVTQRNGSMSLSVLVACGAGAGIALLREVAHADTVLPLPRGINVHAVSNADANASAPPHRTDGTLKLLPLDDYDRHTLRVGGVRVRGGTGKVAFSDIPNRAP